MFTLTIKSHYGVAAIMELAENYDRGLVQIKSIAAKKNIPINYLEQIFNRLGKSGIIKSVRGINGGYMLGIAPSELTLLHVLETLEGAICFGQFEGSEAVTTYLLEGERYLKQFLSLSIAEMQKTTNDWRTL